MSIQALREFFGRHSASATGLAALVAALDAKASGVALNPALAGRIHDLLVALGAGDLLEGVTAAEAAPLVPELRHQLAFDAKLLYRETRTTSWVYTDEKLLQDTGDFARAHAHALSRMVIPALDGLPARFAAPGARFLDVGVGVAGLAIAMTELWPSLHVTGIDVWQPSLQLARKNVEKAGLRERIELREQAAEKLDDQQAFDLAWLPLPFMPERAVAAACERLLPSLRPGGWLVIAFANLSAVDPVTAALWRLRITTFGGPQWGPAEVEGVLREKGYADVRTFPTPPGVPVGLTVGRRQV